MKISQDQKEVTRKSIIRAAVELIEGADFKAATMRQIAKAAGVGDATIYNYFPTKEAILYAYYLDHMQACIEALKAVPDFNTFSLQEQLQTLFDTSFNLYLADREFVSQTFRLVLLSSSRDWPQIKPIRALFLSAVNDMLAAAVEVGEIPDQVFEELLGQFFMDAYIGTVLYWIADRSENFHNTGILVDQGLGLACAVLKAGIANKIFDMAAHLFKTHILSQMERFIDPMTHAGRIKRQFMEGMKADESHTKR